MTELGRYRKQIFIEDEKKLRQWQKELGLSTFAEVLHVVCDAYQNQIDKQELLDQHQNILDQQKKLQTKISAIGKELSTLSELSSDFYYRNQYLRSGTINVGTDCDAWRNAERRIEEKIQNKQERAASHLRKYR